MIAIKMPFEMTDTATCIICGEPIKFGITKEDGAVIYHYGARSTTPPRVHNGQCRALWQLDNANKRVRRYERRQAKRGTR